MWKNSRSIKSLDDRIKEHREDFYQTCACEREKEFILDELKKTKLWNYDPVRIRSWDYSAHTLNLSLYDISVEMVIDIFCGHLHQVYGIDWKMSSTSDYIQLQSQYGNIAIVLEVHEESMQTCEIKRRITRIRDKKEMDAFRYVYSYEVDCGDA